MSRWIRLLCVTALFAIARDAAWSQEATCKFEEWGYSYYRIEQQGELWTYLLSASGPKWRHSAYGRHGPGLLSCETCSSAAREARGLYHFITSATLTDTAAARSERRKESVGLPYPHISLGPDHLQHLGTREGISIGPLSGYAVLFRLVINENEPRDSWANLLATKERTHLAIALADGCVALHADILSEASRNGNMWAELDSLLAEVTIKKVRGAVPGPPVPPGPYSAVVRAPRDGDRPPDPLKDQEKQ